MLNLGDRVIVGHRRRHGKVVCFSPNPEYVKVRCDSDGKLREYAVKKVSLEPPTQKEIEAALGALPRVSLEEGMKMRGQPTPIEPR